LVGSRYYPFCAGIIKNVKKLVIFCKHEN
jgi:hypothetical protein